MRYEYISYKVYEAPKSRTEAGKFVREFGYLEQAERLVNNSKKRGFNLFIKGVREDGTEVVFIQEGAGYGKTEIKYTAKAKVVLDGIRRNPGRVGGSLRASQQEHQRIGK